MFLHPRLLLFSLLLLALIFVLASVALAQGAVTVQTANRPLFGQILTDGSGKTLYMFQNDKPGVSNCSGNCAQTWPPLTATSGVTPTLASGVTGALTTLKRQDGTTQVQFNNMPLYYYAQDTAAGDTKGQGVGGMWWVINPVNGPVKTTAAQTAATSAPTAPATAVSPSNLPTTGSESPVNWLPPLLAVAVLFLLAGLGVSGVRRAR